MEKHSGYCNVQVLGCEIEFWYALHTYNGWIVVVVVFL